MRNIQNNSQEYNVRKKVVICSWVLHKLENELNFRNTLFYVSSLLNNKNKTFISVLEVSEK